MLEQLGSSDAPEVRVQRGRVLLSMALAFRASAGLGTSLGPAVDHARRALQELDGVEPNGAAEARLTLAHLLVEQGDPGSLDEALDLMRCGRRSLEEGIAALQPGRPLIEWAKTVQRIV